VIDGSSVRGGGTPVEPVASAAPVVAMIQNNTITHSAIAA
jgi:hypothetical protein